MNLGSSSTKTLLAALLALTLSLFVAGCGDSDTSSTASGNGATEAAGSTDAGDDAMSKSDSSESAADKKSKEDEKDSSGGDQVNADDPNRPKPTLEGAPKAVQSEVSTAFNRLMKAYKDRDFDYVCTSAYSSDYLSELAKRGGCKKVVNEEVGSVKSVSGRIEGMNALDDNLVEVYVRMTITPQDGPASTNSTSVHFKKQDGDWKYFIFTGSNR